MKPNLGILIKPVSHDCNMACSYCYYRSVQALYPDVRRPRMSAQAFDAVCAQYRALHPREFKISWQGGEPTLMGLEFFEQAVETERRHARRGECPANSLQTNGAVLDDRWSRFLAANGFLVGLSVDGPPDLNVNRRFPDGRPVSEVIMRAMELLKKHRVEFNVLTVVSKANVRHPQRVFQFLLDCDLHYAQFIPCTEPGCQPGRLSPESVTAAEYAEFMIGIFDAWVENDDPSYYVRHIDNWLHLFFDLPPESCEYRGDCSRLLTVEWNGDVYPCDFFVDRPYRLGNVLDQTLEQMLRGRTFRAFVEEAARAPGLCQGCQWFRYCRGGCYRHRGKLGIAPDAPPFLCEANKRIFSHVFSRLRRIKEQPTSSGTGPEPARASRLHAFLNTVQGQIAAGAFCGSAATAEQAMSGADALPPGAPHRAWEAGRGASQRNAPCPCGSGKKFKHCCGKVARTSHGR